MIRVTLEDVEQVLGLIEPGTPADADVQRTLAQMLRSTPIEGATLETIQRDEFHEVPLTVVRDRESKVAWIIADDADRTRIYGDPQLWLESVAEYARQEGWDQDEAPRLATAFELAGTHHGGTQLDPTPKQRIEAESGERLMWLYRELMGSDE